MIVSNRNKIYVDFVDPFQFVDYIYTDRGELPYIEFNKPNQPYVLSIYMCTYKQIHRIFKWKIKRPKLCEPEKSIQNSDDEQTIKL